MHGGVIVTGFEPFSHHIRNISQQVVDLLSTESISDFKISTSILTVDESGSREVSERIDSGENIGAVLHLGFSENANEILLERSARNIFHMEIEDNSGRRIPSGKISDGKPIFETKVPINFIENYLSEISKIRWNDDAGGFVCNETYFRSLQSSSSMQFPIVLFAHLPDESVLPAEEQCRIIISICKSLNKLLLA